MKQSIFALLLVMFFVSTLTAQTVTLKKQNCKDVVFYRGAGSTCEIDYPGAKSEDITVEGTGVKIYKTGSNFTIAPDASLSNTTLTLKIKAKGKKTVSMEFPLKSLGKASFSVGGCDLPGQMSLSKMDYTSFHLNAVFMSDSVCREAFSCLVVSYEVIVGPNTYTPNSLNTKSDEIRKMIRKNGKGSLLYTKIKVMKEGKEVKMPDQKLTIVK